MNNKSTSFLFMTIKKIITFIKKQKIWIIISGIILISGSLSLYFVFQKNDLMLVDESNNFNNDFLEENCLTRRILDGVCNKDDTGAVAVMIDNHSEARPPAGINQASVVFEAIVEAPITRLLAIYDLSEMVELIGPVRSARPYYVDWVTEFAGLYAHVGGSNEALTLLKNRDLIDFNEFNNGEYYWRDHYRYAPHNTFTNMEQIRRMLDDKKLKVSPLTDGWKFKNEAEVGNRGFDSVLAIDYRNLIYNVEWKYEAENNVYWRYQLGQQAVDVSNQPITAKNIVVMYSESEVIDSYGRRQTQVLGDGPAQVFLDGGVFDATWRRTSLSNRTKFYKITGEEIEFNAGLTWIQVLPTHFPQVKITDGYVK